MKKKDYFILAVVAVAAFLLGIFLFSGNSEDGSPQILGSKKCNWETLNQGIISNYEFSGELSQGAFVAPWGISYSEVKFTGLGVVATATAHGNIFTLNGIECGAVFRDEDFLNDFTDTCVGSLNEGMNFFNFTSRRNIILKEIFVEMEYRPANCL